MATITIFGLYVSDRVKNTGEIQKVLTEYGCNIKTRLGLHEVSDNICSTNGVILLEMFGDDSIILEAEKRLLAIDGCQLQKIVFKK